LQRLQQKEKSLCTNYARKKVKKIKLNLVRQRLHKNTAVAFVKLVIHTVGDIIYMLFFRNQEFLT